MCNLGGGGGGAAPMLAMGLPQQYSHDYVIQHYQLLKVTDGLSAIYSYYLSATPKELVCCCWDMAFFRRRDVGQAFRNNRELEQFVLTDVTPTGRILGTGSFGSVEEVNKTV